MKKAFLILIALLIASSAVNVWLMVRGPKVETTIETKRDTVWRDTVIEKPVAAETIQTGRVVYIKVPVHGADHGDRLLDSLYPRQCWNQEPVPRDLPHDWPDSIDVPVPIVQKRYDDSLYTAWVSGFEPALDSILIHQREIINTVTITNTIREPMSRLTFGVQAGAGVGIITRQPDFYLGIGAQYNLWRK